MRIGVFDSGIGGVTVLSELRKRFPSHEYLYFGDTANVPYGSKSPAQIKSLAASAAERIRALGVGSLVIACNTASSLAMEEIRRVMGSIPVLGVVEAGATAVTVASRGRNLPVLVLATRATTRSRVYSTLLASKLSPQSRVIEQECPLLVPLIEEGWVSHPVLDQVVSEYIQPYRTLAPGVALLGCTHYPWIQANFEKALPGWSVINSAHAIADALQGALSAPSAAAFRPVEWRFSDPDSVPLFVFTEELGGRPSLLQRF